MYFCCLYRILAHILCNLIHFMPLFERKIKCTFHTISSVHIFEWQYVIGSVHINKIPKHRTMERRDKQNITYNMVYWWYSV